MTTHLNDVVVAIADARRTTIYRYHAGALERVDRVRSHHPFAHAEHLGGPPRNGFHTGTRGRTARDAAQRTLRYGRDRMLREAATRIAETAQLDDWIVVAGTDAIVSRLLAQLSDHAHGRVARADGIDVHSTESEIASAAARTASAMTTAFELKRLTEVAEAAGGRGLGLMGPADTSRALDHVCVHTLFVTPRFCEQHATEADRAVRIAMDQNADVALVNDEAAALLDERGGIAAALRFRPVTLELQLKAAEAQHHVGRL